MNDTDEYEGHSGPWTLEHLEDDEGQQWFEIPTVHYTTKQSGDGSQQEYADARLIADAPLLLAEVKRLREVIDKEHPTFDWASRQTIANLEAEVKRLREQLKCGGEEE